LELISGHHVLWMVEMECWDLMFSLLVSVSLWFHASFLYPISPFGNGNIYSVLLYFENI
jgi:hypothetical protein